MAWSSRRAALDSRVCCAAGVQKASRQTLSWCSNKPFSRHQACRSGPVRACVSFSASRRCAGLQEAAATSTGSVAAGVVRLSFWFDLLIHFLSVPSGMFSSWATVRTLLSPRSRTLIKAWFSNSLEWWFLFMGCRFGVGYPQFRGATNSLTWGDRHPIVRSSCVTERHGTSRRVLIWSVRPSVRPTVELGFHTRDRICCVTRWPDACLQEDRRSRR